MKFFNPLNSNFKKINAVFACSLFLFSALFTGCKYETYVSENNVSAADAVNQLTGLDEDWYKKSTFYHIWVKSFNDTDNDGIGDFAGIEEKLDYIQNTVGCDAIWLSPVFECGYKSGNTGNMHGYDITDFYAVNSYFSSGEKTSKAAEEELISLIKACHERGMKIIFDFVPNHTSQYNQWFIDSCDSSSDKASWYVWNGSASPASVNTGMSSSGWTYNSTRKAYYYHAFDTSMPDLNYSNDEVREEMKNVVRYWLNKGFDGLRVDAVRYLCESGTNGTDQSQSHVWFAELRSEIEKYSSPKFMVCEAWIEGDRSTLDSYLGTKKSPEFNMVFDFNQGRKMLSSVQDNSDEMDDTFDFMANPSAFYGEAYGTFMCNHDEYEQRLGTEMSSNESMMKEATAISLLRPTVPFIYYGQEIGMKNDSTYGTGDIRLRRWFDWTTEASLESASNSLLKLNKGLNDLRKAYPEVFAYGTIDDLNASSGKAYTLSYGSDTLLCVFNFNSTANDVSFSLSDFGGSEYSVLLYDGKDENAASLTLGSSALSASVPAYGYRVYYLGSDDEDCFFGSDGYTGSVLYSTMYISGTLNSSGWTGGDLMTASYDSSTEESTYVITKSLTGGTSYQFKFRTSTSDWTTNWGASSSDTSVTADSEKTLVSGGENLVFTPSETGNYTFTLVIENSTENACLTVSSAEQEI